MKPSEVICRSVAICGAAACQVHGSRNVRAQRKAGQERGVFPACSGHVSIEGHLRATQWHNLVCTAPRLGDQPVRGLLPSADGTEFPSDIAAQLFRKVLCLAPSFLWRVLSPPPEMTCSTDFSRQSRRHFAVSPRPFADS